MQPKHFKKREAILECLRETNIHPSADQVFARLKPQYPDISLGTVYRNLALFKEQGLITSLGTIKGVERFDGNTDPHVHFVCEDCGAVLDLPELEVPQVLAESASRYTGGQARCCQLTFTGACRDCKEKEVTA